MASKDAEAGVSPREAMTAEEFAKKTPKFWTVAVYQGRRADHCGWACEFAEAYYQYRASQEVKCDVFGRKG